jgi:hypothetical protein
MDVMISEDAFVRPVTRESTVIGALRQTAAKTMLAVRLTIGRRKIAQLADMLEEYLAQHADDSNRDMLLEVLGHMRGAARGLARRRERIMDTDRLGGLDRAVLRLLDENLVVVEDVIETLELCVDPAIRDYLEREIRQIAATNPPNTRLHAPA